MKWTIRVEHGLNYTAMRITCKESRAKINKSYLQPCKKQNKKNMNEAHENESYKNKWIMRKESCKMNESFVKKNKSLGGN